MYESYWGLQRKPFENTADAAFYYPGESHQAALLKLRYAVENRRQGAILTGAPGLGKSLLVQAVFRHLPSTVAPRVHLVFPQLSPDELLIYLADEVSHGNGVRPATGLSSRHEAVRSIQEFLENNVRAGRHALLVIDEAHLIVDSSAWDTLRLLLNFETDGQSGLTLMFVGQPSLLPLLDRRRDLEERLAVKCLLRPLDVDECVAYVAHRLRHAGATRTIFSDAAQETLHHLSQGVPRLINRICDLALLIGFAEESSLIEPDALEAVAEELMTVVPE